MRFAAALCLLLGGSLSLCPPALGFTLGAEEITPFKVTGVEGNVTVRYAQDSLKTGQPGSATVSGAKFVQEQSGLRTEVSVMTHSYVYHPNFLTLDIGGGPILHHESFATAGSETTARGALYNFTARAGFLRDKPYRGSLFFEHLNPTVSIAPGMVLTQENTRYGLDFSLLAPVTPIPLQVNYTHTHMQGQGVERRVDDKIDQFNFNANRSYGSLGGTQLQYQYTQQASLSGSQNLTTQESTAKNQAVNVDTRIQLGSDRQYDLTNLVSLNRQSYTLSRDAMPDLQDMRFMLGARARHSAKLHSYGQYNYGHNSQGDLVATSQAGSLGLSYWPWQGLETTLGLRGEDNDTRQFTARNRGFDGSIRYEHALPIGVGQANYAIRYDDREQRATAPLSGIIGEPATLSGVTYAVLGRLHVTNGSVVVRNATRTQTYVEGIDYMLTLVGTETRLQRLIGGRIIDGEQVLVDYSYDTGGSFAYREVDQNLNLNWAVTRHVNLYFRYVNALPQLTAGFPTFPLNHATGVTAGARADIPFKWGVPFTIGGSMERERRQETVASYWREADDIYLQTDEPALGLGQFRVSAHRARVEYANAAQNVNLLGYDMRIWSRQWFGIDLSAAANYERDNGGLLPRTRMDGSLNAQWQQRKLTLTTSLIYTREMQGGSERSRTLFQFLARREL